MENTYGIALPFHVGHSIMDVYQPINSQGRIWSFHMELRNQFHVQFHIPYCFPSYIKLGNMEWMVE